MVVGGTGMSGADVLQLVVEELVRELGFVMTQYLRMGVQIALPMHLKKKLAIQALAQVTSIICVPLQSMLPVITDRM